MSMLYILIPLALMLLAVAAWALIWAIRTGQFDDLESHGWSVVLDDDQKPPPDPDTDPVGGRLAADQPDRLDATGPDDGADNARGVKPDKRP